MTHQDKVDRYLVAGEKLRIVVGDIDGCIMDNEHRVHHFVEGRVAEYHSLWEGDRVIEQARVIYSMFMNDLNTIFLFITGRAEHCRPYTMMQLTNALGTVDPNQLLMRPDELTSQMMHDLKLKPHLLELAGFELEDVFLAIDDRNSVVAAWRDLGIQCWQPRYGDF